MRRNVIRLIAMCAAMCFSNVSFAQSEYGFAKFDVETEFTANGFEWFRDAQLLAAGDKDASNAMTIGWGAVGTLWRKPALTVYVAEQRYTKKFMDKEKFFTVMSFDEKHADVLMYMGQNSGRDGDKAKKLGLTVVYTENGTPYYKEATVVIECRTMYAATLEKDGFKSDVPEKMYANFPAGLHSMYIGEVVGAWRR